VLLNFCGRSLRSIVEFTGENGLALLKERTGSLLGIGAGQAKGEGIALDTQSGGKIGAEPPANRR